MLDEVIGSPTKYHGKKFRVIDLPRPQRLSKTQKGYLKLALKLAETSEVPNRHGCVVTRGGSVLAMGVNKVRNPQFIIDSSSTNTYNGNLTVHAEVDALSRIEDASNCTVYVARISKTGVPMFSRPCEHCERLLNDLGVKRVVYTV